MCNIPEEQIPCKLMISAYGLMVFVEKAMRLSTGRVFKTLWVRMEPDW